MLDPADEVRVDPRRGAQPQPLAVAQVDEAGVAVGRLAQQVDDAVEDAVEVGRRRDDADDRVQRLALQRDALEIGASLDGHGVRLLAAMLGHEDRPPAQSASEQLQVAVELPLRDLLVRGLELGLLDLREVVDVVLAPGVAERRAQDVVLLELAGGVEQVGGQRLDPEVVALALA